MIIKRFLKSAGVLALAAAIAVGTCGCYLIPDEEEVIDAPAVKANDVTYSTITATKKDLEKKIVATGTVTSEKQYKLSFSKQSGTISKFYVSAGDSVKKGDKICELDTYELDYQIEEKKLNLKKAQLNVTITKQNKGTQAQIDSAQVDADLVKHELEKLETQKSDSALTAPIDGIVSSITDVRVGDNVNPGQEIATVMDTSKLYIAIKPEELTPYKMNMDIKIRINTKYYEGTVFMTPKGLVSYKAELAKNHNSTDKAAIDYKEETVYVRFKDTPPLSSVGNLADTILVQASVKNAVVISNNLIKSVNGENVVYVLKKGAKTSVKVKLGLATGSETEIKSGISAGDELIVR